MDFPTTYPEADHATTALNAALGPGALAVMRTIENAGFEAWVVGGFVRDVLLGRKVHDVDLATNATWQQVQAACEAAGMHTFETGVAHGTLSVLPFPKKNTLPHTGFAHETPPKEPGAFAKRHLQEIIEVTTFRSDGTYSDARHPDSVSFVQTIEEDLARRDFTINAIAWHPKRGLRDPYGGAADLAAQRIRAVGFAQERFEEDALRIVRAVRLASELDFAVDAETLVGASAALKGLAHIAIERITPELTRLLCGPAVVRVLLDHAPIIDAVLPELAPLRGFDQKSPYHIYDIMEHTARVVEGVPPEPLLRWAALLHDVGKPASFTVGTNGQGHFYGHAKVSGDITHALMQRLKMPGRFAADVEQLVRFHDTHIEPRPNLVKRLLHNMGDRPKLLAWLCDLQVADAKAHALQYQERGELARRVRKCLDQVIAEHQVFSLKDLAISGSDVVALGVEAGPRIGELLNRALEAVIDETVPNDPVQLRAFIKNNLQA